ncbi:hypothetical protein FHY18_000594 [Xanthomonas arboricola]|nr:hypothetical protein [Xanthomonas sp. 3793]
MRQVSLSKGAESLQTLHYRSGREVTMDKFIFCKKILLCLCLLWVPSTSTVLAQTACPIGTAAGSAMCGPTSGSDANSNSNDFIPAPAPRPNGEWLKTWGAVAQASTGDTGLSKGFLSKREASVDALNKCANWGAVDCKVIVTYRNQCIASVNPTDGSASGAIANASSIETAEKIAREHCEKSGRACKLTFSDCSEPKFKSF